MLRTPSSLAYIIPQSFQAKLLASEENMLGLMAVNRELVAQAEGCNESDRVVRDMDSTESPVHGQL